MAADKRYDVETMRRYAFAPLALLLLLGLTLTALCLLPTTSPHVDVMRLASWMLGVSG